MRKQECKDKPNYQGNFHICYSVGKTRCLKYRRMVYKLKPFESNSILSLHREKDK